METPVKKTRKPGTGIFERKGQKKKGSYKIYYLSDDSNIVRYVGITTQWLCKRLAYHNYQTRKEEFGNKFDDWYMFCQDNNMKVKIVELEMLPIETTKKQALERENYYINLYSKTTLNSELNVFGTKQVDKGIWIQPDVQELIREVSYHNISNKEMSELLNIKHYIICYWRKKFGYRSNKHNEWLVKDGLIKGYLDLNTLVSYTGLRISQVRYVLKKLSKL